MFRLTLRELLLLITVTGLLIGWQVDHRTLNQKLVEVSDDAKQLASHVGPGCAYCQQLDPLTFFLRERYKGNAGNGE
jgi:hypothetical protein